MQIIGRNQGDPCPACGKPIDVGHSCSQIREVKHDDGTTDYIVEAVMITLCKVKPRKMFKMFKMTK